MGVGIAIRADSSKEKRLETQEIEESGGSIERLKPEKGDLSWFEKKKCMGARGEG